MIGKGLKEVGGGLKDNQLVQGLTDGTMKVGKNVLNFFDDDDGQEQSKTGKKANQLKQDYMDKYSIKIDIPSLDIQSSTFFPLNNNLCLQCINYVIPEPEYDITTHYIEEGRLPDEGKTFEDIYDQYKDGVNLRLLK